MIEKIQLKFFKQFKDQSFELKDAIVLAGPNNTGKTILLQAIATWYFAFREWQKKRIAVKIVDDRGIESLLVLGVDK